jgi:hypothetical protein
MRPATGALLIRLHDNTVHAVSCAWMHAMADSSAGLTHRDGPDACADAYLAACLARGAGTYPRAHWFVKRRALRMGDVSSREGGELHGDPAPEAMAFRRRWWSAASGMLLRVDMSDPDQNARQTRRRTPSTYGHDLDQRGHPRPMEAVVSFLGVKPEPTTQITALEPNRLVSFAGTSGPAAIFHQSPIQGFQRLSEEVCHDG